jgi:serine/threonine protein phosphatase PrpC
MLQKASPYSIPQYEDRSLRVIEQERLSWRFLYYRSAESDANRAPSQDYLTYQHGDDSFAFAVCDGVGQSFFGDLASRLLGEGLIDWLCTPAFDTGVSQADVRASVGELLREVTKNATKEVEALKVPFGTPQMVEEVLNDKRKLGSESTFVCVRVDLPTQHMPEGRLIAAWMGDTRLRAWGPTGELTALLPTETFQTDERWSSKSGPVNGDPHVLVTPLGGDDSSPAVTGLMAYTDGLAILDRLTESPTDDDLTNTATGTRHSGQSDDIAFIELRLQSRAARKAAETRPLEKADANATVDAPVTVVADEPLKHPSPRARRRRRRTPLTRDPVVLVSLAGILVVLVYVLRSFGFPDVVLQSVQAPDPATRVAASPNGTAGQAAAPVPLLTSLDWQPTQSAPELVLAAYFNYWKVITQAFFDVDPSHLSEVATGTEWELNRKLLAGLKAENHAVEFTVTHKETRVASRGNEMLLTDLNTITKRGFNRETKDTVQLRSVPYGDSPTRPTYVLVQVVQPDGSSPWKVAYAQ